MKTTVGTLRTTAYLLFLLLITATLAACGGGGSTAGNASSSVSVSIASAPSYPAGTTFASSTSSTGTTAAPPNSPPFDNVFVTVTKLALIPSSGPEFPDPDGELEAPNSPSGEGKGFVTVTLSSPVVIDLKHLSGDNAAMLLNRFPEVPAGDYSKIRVYYDNVVGRSGGVDTLFHPTAHYHFDVHFVGGNLVIPVATDPQGGIKLFSVVIDVVGLKYHQAGQSGNVLLRPQVFAKVGAPKFIVHGIAEQVNHSAGTFDVVTAGSVHVHAAYLLNTLWFFQDGRLVGPFPSGGVAGVNALDNTAIVDVIGTFQGGVLMAEEVDITFPSVLFDNVYLGWTVDNTIILRFTGDNVVSVPNARRNAVYYDNAVFPYNQLTDAAIVDHVFISARGYTTAHGIKAYWISIWP